MSKFYFKSLLIFAACVSFSAWGASQNELKAASKRLSLPPAQSQPQVLEVKPDPDRSGVFGAWLFSGNFANTGFTGFNPNYLINIGDTIILKLWGAFELEVPLIVDPQGNIFVPRVGPVKVSNVRNGDLNDVVESKIKTIYRENVGVYASLAEAQRVKIFVSGNVRKPGLFEGFSADSVLHFLDRAGGIATERGSFLDIRVLRNGHVHSQINLYDFLLNGQLPSIQFRDGDSIFVAPIKHSASFNGLVKNPFQLEFVANTLPLIDALNIVGVSPNATHVRITRNQGVERNVEYFGINQADKYVLQSGDEVTILADKTVGTIIVQVEGEHIGLAEYVLPYGASLGELVNRIQLSKQSDIRNLQLYRKSLVDRQKFMLDQTLRALETEVLSARSESLGEAGLRTQEAQLILQFIERAKAVQPRGQVVLANTEDKLDIVLEDGDRLRVPKKSRLISVHGEVYFPSAFLYELGLSPEDYIEKSGGFSQKANKSRILVMHQNGEVEQHKTGVLFGSSNKITPGDEILVMPEVDFKSFQFTKDLVEVIYQIAVSAGVILRI